MGVAVAAILLSLLWVPAGAAHGGEDVTPLRPFPFGIRAGESFTLHVQGGGPLPGDGLFVLSAASHGPGAYTVSLWNETAGIVATWSVPADGNTVVGTARLPATGEYHLDFTSARGAQGAFYIDFPGHAVTTEASVRKDLPLFPPRGAVVFGVDIQEPGRHRIVLADPPAHTVRATVLAPDAATTLATSRTPARDGAHALTFAAQPGTHFLLIEAIWTTDQATSPSHIALVPLLEGPLPGRDAPLPGAFAIAFALAGAVALGRRP